MKIPANGLIVAGILVGVFVGVVGTGGAFLIPVLVYIFKLDQLKAPGTALLIAASPVWIFPFIPYYRAGHYETKTAILLASGLALGGYLGLRKTCLKIWFAKHLQ
jgi:uncharacterized membrane protein YfcA